MELALKKSSDDDQNKIADSIASLYICNHRLLNGRRWKGSVQAYGFLVERYFKFVSSKYQRMIR